MINVRPTGKEFAANATKEQIAELWERHLLDCEKMRILEQRNLELVKERNQIAAQKTEELESLVADDRQSVLEAVRWKLEIGRDLRYINIGKKLEKLLVEDMPSGPAQCNRYNTDNTFVLTIYRDGKTWDIEVPKR